MVCCVSWKILLIPIFPDCHWIGFLTDQDLTGLQLQQGCQELYIDLCHLQII